jgi:hypothetical protein
MRDLPDYTREMVLRYTGGFIGLEELAARLGSVVPWDLQGNILLAEDFETEETEYTTHAETAASEVVRTTRHKFLGDWSMKLSTGSVADEYTSISREILGTKDCKVAVFALLGFEPPVKMIQIDAWSWDGTTYHHPSLIYRRSTQQLTIVDGDGNEQVIASSLVLGGAAFKWYPFRLDFDLATGYYHKAYVAGEEYDLSAYAAQGGATSGAPFIALTVSNYAEAAVGCDINLDSLVVAKNIQ